MILFQNFAHNAIRTGWLSHTGTKWHLVLVSAGSAGRAFEVYSTGTILPSLAQGVQLTAVLLKLGRCGFKNLLVLVCFKMGARRKAESAGCQESNK